MIQWSTAGAWVSILIYDYKLKTGCHNPQIYVGKEDDPVSFHDACAWADRQRHRASDSGLLLWFKYRVLGQDKVRAVPTPAYIPYQKARELAGRLVAEVRASVPGPCLYYRLDRTLTDELEELVVFGVQQGCTKVCPTVVEQAGDVSAVEIGFTEDEPDHLLLIDGLLELELRPLSDYSKSL